MWYPCVIVQILCRRVNCAMQDCGLLESNDQANTQNRYADKTNTVCPTTSSVLTPGECKDNSDSVVADVCGRSYADYPDGPLTTTCGHVPYTGQYIALFFSIHAQGWNSRCSGWPTPCPHFCHFFNSSSLMLSNPRPELTCMPTTPVATSALRGFSARPLLHYLVCWSDVMLY